MADDSSLALIDSAAPVSTKDVSTDIKNSALFNVRWESLLMSAPIALSSLGACYVASSSPVAQGITLTISKDSKLSDPSLIANLHQCGNLGTAAFVEAESSMAAIQLNAQMVDSKVKDIVNALTVPQMAARNLPTHINSLVRAAEQCRQSALAMDQKFDAWLDFICDLRVACVSKSSSTAEELRTNKISLLADQAQLDYQKMAVSSAENATKQLETQLSVASEAYKKASDEFPSGWDIVGQQVVSGLADTFNTALNAAIPVLMENLSPLRKLNAATNMVGDIINDIQDDNPQPNPASRPGNPPQTRPGAPAAPVDPPKVPYNTDPAYSHINSYMIYLNILNDILTGGKNKSIDWDKARGSTDSDAKSSVTFVVAMLKNAVKSFASLATSDQPSVDYKDVLQVSLQIATSIDGELKDANNAANTLPTSSSAIVQVWQKDFEMAYSKAYNLYSIAKSLPGNPPNGFPLTSDTQTAISPDPRTAQAQAILEAAKNRLSTTQEAYKATQANFLNSTKLLTEQQIKLGEIQSAVVRLQQTTMDLEQVKSVLQECIALVVSMKSEVVNLVRFFNIINTVIDSAVRNRVQDWTDTIASSVTTDGSTNIAKIGNYSLIDGQREMIYRGAVIIRSYFSVYSDVAAMWVKLSDENIQPGMAFIESLSIIKDNSDDTKRKAKALQDWTAGAVNKIKAETKAYYDKISDGIDSRVDKFAAITKQLPPSETVQQAIKDGSKKVQNDTSAVIAQKSKITVADWD